MLPKTNESKLQTSKKLKEIQEIIPKRNVSLNQLFEIMSGEAIQLLVIILLAPFLIPMSIPGSSTPFGILIIILEVSFIFDKPAHLPNFIGKFELSKENVQKLFEILEKALSYVEKISKPRGTLSIKKYTMKFNAVLIITLSFLLFLPLPIPLTDFVPALSILLLTVSSMERDSYLMIIGYLCTTGSYIYFASVGYVGVGIIVYVLRLIGIPI